MPREWRVGGTPRSELAEVASESRTEPAASASVDSDVLPPRYKGYKIETARFRFG